MLVTPMQDPALVERIGQSSSFGVRSTGLHLSTIIKSLMRRLQPKRFGSEMTPESLLRMELGIAFENMLEQGLAEKYAVIRPGELFSDEGIAMSPDGINPTADAGEEYKCTWMSCRIDTDKGMVTPYTDKYGRPVDRYLHWFLQIKGYAKWLGTNRFLLRVLHVNGDYAQGAGKSAPQFLTHLLEFTDDELEENWTMLTNYARQEGMLL